MTRLTEYHNGVAVIKDKRFKEAAEKLALFECWFEDLESWATYNRKIWCDTEAPADVRNAAYERMRAYEHTISILKGGRSDE